MNKTEQILNLIAPFVKEGKILHRDYAQINDNIEDFVLLFDNNKLIACAGLKAYQAGNMGEVYSLAVSQSVQKTGVSSKLLAKIMNQAKILKFSKIFALSKHNTNWFIKQGFVQMQISQLPKKRQALFDHQRNPSIFFKDVN